MECWMRSHTTYRALRAALHTAWSYTWRSARPTLGWVCGGVGVLGLALPLLPGVPLLVLGVALVGRRTWIIRGPASMASWCCAAGLRCARPALAGRGA